MAHTDGVPDNSLNADIALHQAQIAARGIGFVPLATADVDNGNVAVIEDDGTLFFAGAGGALNLDFIAVIEKFYASHPDIYDFVAMFPAVATADGSFARLVHSTTTGIQMDVEDNRGQLAVHPVLAGTFHTATSPIANLKNYTHYQDLPSLPVNPNTIIPGNNDNPLSLIAQEVGHYWGIASQFQPIAGPPNSIALQGRGASHWSFFAHTNFSSMEGCAWVPNAVVPPSWTSVGQTNGYSNMDLYLMGLINPATPINAFFIQAPVVTASPPGTGPFTSTSTPLAGVTVQGAQVNVATAQIVAALGPRVPSSVTAQTTFKMAFILVVPNGWTTAPFAAQLAAAIAQLQGYATAWVPYWNNATGGVSIMDIGLATPRPTDLYIRDNLLDDGTQPSVGGWLSDSPDILIVKNPLVDPAATFGAPANAPASELVEIGNTNYIYLRAFNRGAFPADATAQVYFAPLSTSVTPASWTLLGTLDIPLTMVNDFTIAGPLAWPSVPDPGTSGHYCLIAILNNTLDPAPDTTPIVDVATFLTAMRASNNIAYLNVFFEDVLADSDADADFVLGSFAKATRSAFAFDAAELPKSWRVNLRLPKEVMRQRGIEIEGFKKGRGGELVLAGGQRGAVNGVELPARSSWKSAVRIETAGKARHGQKAYLRVAQYVEKKQTGQVNLGLRIVQREKVPFLAVRRTGLYYPAAHPVVRKLPNHLLRPFSNIHDARTAGFDPGFGLPFHRLGPATVSRRLAEIILQVLNGAESAKAIVERVNRQRIPEALPLDLRQFLGLAKKGFDSASAKGLLSHRKLEGAYRTLQEVWTAPGMTAPMFYLLVEALKKEVYSKD